MDKKQVTEMTEETPDKETAAGVDIGTSEPERMKPEKGDTLAMMIAMAEVFLPKALIAIGSFVLVFWLLYKFWLHC